MKIKIEKIYPLIFWLIVWWITSKLINESLFFPSPLITFKALSVLIFKKNFLISILSTVIRVFIGLIVANISGIFFGLLSGLNDKIYKIVSPFITIIRSTPVISFIIIALVWFKSSNVPIFISFLMCFPIIWTNIVEGFKKVDTKLLEMCKIYNISTIKQIKKVYIPSLIPFYIAGFNLALGISWKVTIAAEVLSHPTYAIGTNLSNSKIYLDTPELFAWTFVIIILSYIFEILITNFLNNKFKKFY